MPPIDKTSSRILTGTVLAGVIGGGITGYYLGKSGKGLQVPGRMRVKPALCVEACLDSMGGQATRSRSDFGQVVQQCDLKFGNGCWIEEPDGQ